MAAGLLGWEVGLAVARPVSCRIPMKTKPVQRAAGSRPLQAFTLVEIIESERLLLPADVQRYVDEAESSNVLR